VTQPVERGIVTTPLEPQSEENMNVYVIAYAQDGSLVPIVIYSDGRMCFAKETTLQALCLDGIAFPGG